METFFPTNAANDRSPGHHLSLFFPSVISALALICVCWGCVLLHGMPCIFPFNDPFSTTATVMCQLQGRKRRKGRKFARGAERPWARSSTCCCCTKQENQRERALLNAHIENCVRLYPCSDTPVRIKCVNETRSNLQTERRRPREEDRV